MNFPVLVTGGWDAKIKMYDSAQQVLVTEIDAAAEIFDFALDSQGPRIIVGTGNSATSATGRIQIFDLINKQSDYLNEHYWNPERYRT